MSMVCALPEIYQAFNLSINLVYNKYIIGIPYLFMNTQGTHKVYTMYTQGIHKVTLWGYPFIIPKKAKYGAFYEFLLQTLTLNAR